MSKKYECTKAEIFAELEKVVETLAIPVGMGGLAAEHFKAGATVPWGIYTQAPSAIIGGHDTVNLVGIMLPLESCGLMHTAVMEAMEKTGIKAPAVPNPLPAIAGGPAIIPMPPTSGTRQ